MAHRLTKEQLQAALDVFDLGEVRAAAPVSLGNWGQNVFVETDRGDYVFRGWPARADQLPGERYFARLLHERTSAPVAWPYLWNRDPSVLGWDYAVMPRLPGIQLFDPSTSLDAGDRAELARATGEALAELHRLEWPFCGRFSLPLGEAKPDADCHSRLLDRALEDAEAQLAGDELAFAREALADTTILDRPFRPRFVHGDFHERNVVAERTDRWRVSGVFDLEGAHFGDAEADLVRNFAVYVDEGEGRESIFLDAYFAEVPRPPGLGERLRLWMVADRVAIWRFAHEQGVVWWDETLSFREWAAPFLDRIETL